MNLKLMKVLLFFLTLSGLSSALADGVNGRHPNVVVILVDDFGFGDAGINNPIASTPNIDDLARKSVQFDNFYVNASCSPTRAAFLTGRQYLRTGLWGIHGSRDYVSTRETMISEVFKLNGYTTGMMGKWHSGRNTPYFPWERGFDEAHMARLYKFTPKMGAADRYNGKVYNIDTWSEAYFTDRALDFIESNKNNPFFLYVPYMSTHSFWRAPQEYINKHRQKGHSEALSVFFGMSEFVDFQIGRIIEKIEALGLDEDTLFVFFSDNGPTPKGGGKPFPQKGTYYTRNKDWDKRNPLGLRGRKGHMYENGIKSPLYIYQKGRIGGKHVKEVANVMDLYPTLVQLAELEMVVPKQLPLDGLSLAPLIYGEQNQSTIWDERSHFFVSGSMARWTDETKMLRYPPVSEELLKTKLTFEAQQNMALRRGDYKWVKMGGEIALFDIEKDPREEVPIENEAMLTALEREAKRQWDSILQSEHVFHKPIQLIGQASGTGFSIVQATAAIKELGNARVGSHEVFNLKEKGDGFSVNTIVYPGEYEVFINYTSVNTPDTSFKLEVAGQQLVFDVDKSFSHRDDEQRSRSGGLFLKEKEIASLSLPIGCMKFKEKQEAEFVLELAEDQRDSDNRVKHLYYLVFLRKS